MTKEITIDEQSVPIWRRGVRTRYDEARQRWMILAPERILVPQGPGVDIARLIDGHRRVADIVDALLEDYEIDRSTASAQTVAFLDDLHQQGYLNV